MCSTIPWKCGAILAICPKRRPSISDMSVEDYLDFVARIKNVPAEKRAERITDALEKTNMVDKRHELIKRLSRGYKQRVGIAQALVHDPDVIILDEPTVGLDPKQIIEVRHLIKNLAGTHTIILSTHILPEVSMTCDRVVIINKGKIAAVDTPQNLTTQLKGGQRFAWKFKRPKRLCATRSHRLPGASRVQIEPARNGRPFHRESRGRAGPGYSQPDRRGGGCRGAGGLYELRGVSLSLEDIFLELTTDDSSHAQPAS